MASEAGGILLILSLVATALAVSSFAPMVNLTTGTVRGTVMEAAGTQVNAFLGIPYAKPPVGELRFKPPVPPEAWDGVYNATEPPRKCYQDARPNEEDNRSEDCLYLNVVQVSSQSHDSAVMVWLHGGGFIRGRSHITGRNGPLLLVPTEHVLVVSMNYRLGALGFLALGTDDAPGNMGLLDQALALQWVQDNIARFGGNPDRVTIFGVSAGAASAHFHLLSPISNGLFQRAILQSGSAFSHWALTPRDVAMTRGRALASALGCQQPEVDDMVACLRSSNAEDIVDNQLAEVGLLNFCFTPVVDGRFLPASPLDLVDSSSLPSLDILAGFTTNEGSSFLGKETSLGFSPYSNSLINNTRYIQSIQTLLPTLNEFGVEAVAFEYTDWVNMENPAMYRDAAENVVGDYGFKCPVVEASLGQARAGGEVYMYQFNHILSNFPPSPWAGVVHGTEVGMVFGWPLNPALNYNMAEVELSRTMMRFWANFAKTGNPNDPGDEVWPAYNQTGQSYILLDTGPVRVEQWPRARSCAFWREYLWQLQQRTDELLNLQPTGAVGGQSSSFHPAGLTYVAMGILLQCLLKQS